MSTFGNLSNASVLINTGVIVEYVLDHAVKQRVRTKPVKYHGGTYGKAISRQGFFKVTKPMYVFKKVYVGVANNQAIANLIIPVGALIYVEGATVNYCNVGITTRKMRASEAYVHSIVTVRDKVQVRLAKSGHDSKFMYVPGTTVKPDNGFDKEEEACAGGIHFFVDLVDALVW